MASLLDIEGIGPARMEALTGAGLKTTDDLLEACGSAAGRKKVAEATGIDAGMLLEWVNRADLFRVKGVGTQYSDLLEAAGVDSATELGGRRADHLLAKMAEINAAKNLVRQLPTEAQVAAWIDNAKTLPKVVTH
jgi:predicted flap endonuclease-1-like 5' DNA nuclease